jgi:single-strand DNA-binding protein
MLNKVILMGRLTRDPELRYTTNNIPMCKFSIAVDRDFARQGEERQTDFFNIVAWRGTAEFCGKYFTKGMQVAVSGTLQNRTWDDQEGKKHYITEVIVSDAYFADSKRAGNDSGNYNQNDNFEQTPSNNIEDDFKTVEEAEDDLPF